MSNWMSSMADIGAMVENKLAAPAEGDAAGKKDPKDGTTGSPNAAAVAPGQPATGAKPEDAPPPAKPEAKSADGDGKPGEVDTGEEKWPRNKKDWDAFKENRKKSEETLKNQIAAGEAKLKELETQLKAATSAPKSDADPMVKAEIERLKTENKQLSDKIMVLDVTQHPEFQAYFDNKTKAQTELAKKIVGPDKSEQLTKLLAMPDSEFKTAQLDEFMSDLTTAQLSRFGGILNALDAIKQEREQEISNAGALKERLTAKQLESAAAGNAKREKWFADTLATVQGAEKIDLFRPKDGDSAWNAGLEARIAKAKEIFLGKANPADVAGAALFAASLPVLVERHNSEIKTRDDKISKLEAQVKALTAAQPVGERGSGAAAPGSDKNEDTATLKPGMSPSEAGAAFVKSMHTMLGSQ